MWGRVVPPLAPPGTPPDGEWLRISPHNAPHQWRTETFKLPAAWFAEGAATSQARNLDLAYEVGGGGGHSLHLRSGAKLKLELRAAAVAGNQTLLASGSTAVALEEAVHVEVDGAPAPERQFTNDSDSAPPAYDSGAQTVVAGTPVVGDAPLVVVAGECVVVEGRGI